MKSKLVLPILILLFGVSTIFGQEESPIPSKRIFKNQIGLAAGFSTGFGISYKRTEGKFGMQVVFSPFVTKRSSTVSAGLTFMYKFYEARYSSLYVYEANHFYHTATKYIGSLNSSKTSMINGIGVGLELLITERVALNLMGGYASYDAKVFSGTAELGLFYKF